MLIRSLVNYLIGTHGKHLKGGGIIPEGQHVGGEIIIGGSHPEYTALGCLGGGHEAAEGPLIVCHLPDFAVLCVVEACQG